MPEPMKTEIRFLKNSEAQPGDSPTGVTAGPAFGELRSSFFWATSTAALFLWEGVSSFRQQLMNN